MILCDFLALFGEQTVQAGCSRRSYGMWDQMQMALEESMGLSLMGQEMGALAPCTLYFDSCPLEKCPS